MIKTTRRLLCCHYSTYKVIIWIYSRFGIEWFVLRFSVLLYVDPSIFWTSTIWCDFIGRHFIKDVFFIDVTDSIFGGDLTTIHLYIYIKWWSSCVTRVKAIYGHFLHLEIFLPETTDICTPITALINHHFLCWHLFIYFNVNHRKKYMKSISFMVFDWNFHMSPTQMFYQFDFIWQWQCCESN